MSTTTSSLLSSVKMSCYFDTLMDHIEGPSQIRTSVSIFLITLAASEVLIYVVCKAIAWYAHVTFYQGDYNWIHETSSDTTTNTPEKIHEPSLKDIQRALCSFVYGSSDMVSNERISDDRCCPICLGEFEHGDAISSGTTCHHYFHQGCITEWLSKRTSCPCCRQSIMKNVVASTPELFPPEAIEERELSWLFRFRDPVMDPVFCLFVF